jgi:hypothetical protein
MNANELTQAEHRKLAKFIFGCMNQKFTIASRVERHGSGELDKVLKFIGRASEAVLEIDRRLSNDVQEEE